MPDSRPGSAFSGAALAGAAWVVAVAGLAIVAPGCGDDPAEVEAPMKRGVWAWRDAAEPWGTDRVVGDPATEAAAVAELVAWGVDRVYGAYGDRPVTEPEVIAAWNARLAAAGIASHALLGDPAWIDEAEWPRIADLVGAWVVDFNAGRTDPAERFVGVHLDIEPQAASDWAAASDAERHRRVEALAATFAFARATLDAGDGAGLALWADLPVWFDELPPALGGSGTVGWPSEAARDAWFRGLADDLEGVTLLAYERGTLSLIGSAVAGEARLFPGEVRVGLDVTVGDTWEDAAALFAMAEALEAEGHAVDLHSFAHIQADLTR